VLIEALAAAWVFGGFPGEPVDYFRLLFAYTVLNVPRTRKLEAHRGSV
jgi:hypothetical protein